MYKQRIVRARGHTTHWSEHWQLKLGALGLFDATLLYHGITSLYLTPLPSSIAVLVQLPVAARFFYPFVKHDSLCLIVILRSCYGGLWWCPETIGYTQTCRNTNRQTCLLIEMRGRMCRGECVLLWLEAQETFPFLFWLAISLCSCSNCHMWKFCDPPFFI